MYLETVTQICNDVFNGKPTEIIRNTVEVHPNYWTL